MAKSKPETTKRARSSKPKLAAGYAHLVESIGGLIESARQRVAQTVNTEMVRLYWEIGRHIVEYEQGGSDGHSMARGCWNTWSAAWGLRKNG